MIDGNSSIKNQRSTAKHYLTVIGALRGCHRCRALCRLLKDSRLDTCAQVKQCESLIAQDW
jgi:hypothetical protein